MTCARCSTPIGGAAGGGCEVATLTATKAALGRIVQGVSAIRRVYVTAPLSLPPSDVPAAVLYTGAGEYLERGYGVRGEARRYLLRLYVAPLQQGIAGEEEAACEPFIPALREAFTPGVRLLNADGSRLAGILETRLLGDNGISVLQLGGAAYLGLEMQLEVLW